MINIENIPILLVILPLMTAFIIPPIGLLKKRYIYHITLISTFALFIMSILLLNQILVNGEIHYYLGNWEPPFGIEYVIDNLSVILITLITFVGFVIVIYSKQSIEKELCKNTVLFYTLFMLLITSLLGMVVTGDLFNFYVFLEISSLTAYTLIAIGPDREALMGSFNYLIMGTIAACSILIGIGFLYALTGSLNMADVSLIIKKSYDSKVIHAAAILFAIGFSIKIALFPLHIWLPDAYTHAPSTVSALIASLMSKVGAYAMIRIFFGVFTIDFFTYKTPMAEIISWIAAIAIIAGSINAIAQKDIKRMLAYSSVSQIGYIVLGIGLSNQLGITGSLLHILNHAFMKGCLFLAVGAIIYKTGMRNIYQFTGMGKRMPYTMLAFSIAALSMVGVPPFGAFFSKWFLALGAIESGKWIFAIIILLSSLLNAAYFFAILERAYFGKFFATEKEEAPLSMVVPTLILATGCIFFGIFIFLFEPFLQSTAVSLV